MEPTRTQRLVSAVTIITCVLVAVGFASPMIEYCQAVDGHLRCELAINRHGSTDDVRYFAALWEAIRVSVLEFHQFPSWNPYHCGGVVLYQDPQAPFPGPLLLLTFFWLPTAVGIKLWFILHLIAGALGARWLVKDMGANAPEQILAAAMVTACGFCAEHFGGGHLSFTPFLFLPWILWAQRRSLREPRWAVLVAVLFAVSFYEGATYPIPLMLVALGLDIVVRLGSASDRRALVPSLAIFGVLFPLLAAARLLPVLAYLEEHPRLVPLDDQMTVAEVFQTWLTREHGRGFPGHVFVWPEYGDYVGLVPVALAMVGVGFALARADEQSRARRIDLALLVGLTWCALGNIPGFSLFGLLHEFPIYKSLRVPSRFLYCATVALALLATWGLITLRAIASESRWRAVLVRALVGVEVVVALFVAVDMCVTNSPRIQQGLDAALPQGRASADFFQDPAAEYWRLPTHPVRGIGTPQCYVPLEWGPAHGLWVGHEAQERVVPPTAGTIREARWSPNAVTFTAQLSRPATVVVNQNFESSWRASTGMFGSRDGLLAVDLPAGRTDVAMTHLPRGLGNGVVLLLLGLVLSVFALWKLTPERLDAWRAWLHAKTLDAPEPPLPPPAAAEPVPALATDDVVEAEPLSLPPSEREPKA